MSKASQPNPTDEVPKPETKIVAKWVCPCGTVTVYRERFLDTVPHHFHCGDMTYIEDVVQNLETGEITPLEDN